METNTSTMNPNTNTGSQNPPENFLIPLELYYKLQGQDQTPENHLVQTELQDQLTAPAPLVAPAPVVAPAPADPRFDFLRYQTMADPINFPTAYAFRELCAESRFDAALQQVKIRMIEAYHSGRTWTLISNQGVFAQFSEDTIHRVQVFLIAHLYRIVDVVDANGSNQGWKLSW